MQRDFMTFPKKSKRLAGNKGRTVTLGGKGVFLSGIRYPFRHRASDASGKMKKPMLSRGRRKRKQVLQDKNQRKGPHFGHDKFFESGSQQQAEGSLYIKGWWVTWTVCHLNPQQGNGQELTRSTSQEYMAHCEDPPQIAALHWDQVLRMSWEVILDQ
ncbi:hypothetical protein GWK47_043926 [Chionoecetes opilio]|uniref:Uncharacterized protein n=1 Tax=Chionoecetes opilio TaxID=41210 RepID=A0A8J4YH46_CHIOP|nr:hypothetical protein GWK47_043926 [Chionoecetes opilio]